MATKERMSSNEWLQMLAAQVKLGVPLTEDDKWKLTQALPILMAEMLDLEVRVMSLECSIDQRDEEIRSLRMGRGSAS